MSRRERQRGGGKKNSNVLVYSGRPWEQTAPVLMIAGPGPPNAQSQANISIAFRGGNENITSNWKARNANVLLRLGLKSNRASLAKRTTALRLYNTAQDIPVPEWQAWAGRLPPLWVTSIPLLPWWVTLPSYRSQLWLSMSPIKPDLSASFRHRSEWLQSGLDVLLDRHFRSVPLISIFKKWFRHVGK